MSVVGIVAAGDRTSRSFRKRRWHNTGKVGFPEREEMAVHSCFGFEEIYGWGRSHLGARMAKALGPLIGAVTHPQSTMHALH